MKYHSSKNTGSFTKLMDRKRSRCGEHEEDYDELAQLEELMDSQDKSFVEPKEDFDELCQLTELIASQESSYVEHEEDYDELVQLKELMDSQEKGSKITENEVSEQQQLLELMESQKGREGVEKNTVTVPSNESNSPRDIFYDIALKIINKSKLCKLTADDSETIWKYNGRCYEPVSEKELNKLVYNFFNERFKRDNNNILSVMNAILTYIRLEVTSNPKYNRNFKEADFEKAKNYIVFRNCIYDLLNDSVRDFSEKLACWISVDADFEYITENFEYSPAYEALKKNATGGDEESMKMIDYTLALMFLNRKVKHFFVAGNASNSGKSVFFSFIDSLMPKGRVMHSEPEDLEGRFALAEVGTVALISCADIQLKQFGTRLVSNIKRITGDTYIRSDRKYKGASEERIFAKILFGTNGGFGSAKIDDGIKNRLIVLPFVNSVPEKARDEGLLEKLINDKNIIISLCARRLGDILCHDGTLIFPESELSLSMKRAWLETEDYVESFFREELTICEDAKVAYTVDCFYRRYEQHFQRKAAENPELSCCKVTERELLKRLEKYSNGRAGNKRGATDEHGNVCKNYVHRVRGCILCD